MKGFTGTRIIHLKKRMIMRVDDDDDGEKSNSICKF